MAMALRYFEPMTAPKPAETVQSCVAKARAVLTRFSPAAPMAIHLVFIAVGLHQQLAGAVAVSLPHKC